ncbi:MAG TPA: 7-cyano-7-deazaguanine synthase QueC [Ferrovibrio sp.]|uniref:7-cyano-7-deazaguanine synthase QueC n=1 Tax=Ferrovibrio sp. TaxID=1917215 RepID=UPI002B4AB8CC|nr:7-cyano-7-deazaguanine synthase QueC [Ferrovibrio sp.]HLT78653.1 7-cyano-7-deazaguanine synthase QueC [Ferrovibrio sp.]
MRKAVVLCSGGIDSATLAYRVAEAGALERLISFDYGQRHRREIERAAAIAARLGARHDVVDIAGLGRFLTSSSLISGGGAVPDGHYAESNMKSTVVPNRNAIMLSIAFGIAAGARADAVGIAVHSGDHFIYPDCRPAFVDAFRAMQDCALEGMWQVELYAPFVNTDKAGIVAEGARLGVPYELTWSCYKGGERHCGRCGTCVERAEAFHLAGVADPTDYEDPDYWKDAVAKMRASIT